MSIKIESPYHETPYEMLSHPDLGPFPINGSCADAEKRWGDLMSKGIMPDAAKASSFRVLTSPAKRIKWDIFCAPFEKKYDFNM